jgi:hypothetical protein
MSTVLLGSFSKNTTAAFIATHCKNMTVRLLKLPKSSEDIILLTRSTHFPLIEALNYPHGSIDPELKTPLDAKHASS